jgi:hypothetical protein
MAADLVPIRLSLTAGDRYTVWAPRWRDAGDEWEAFLGKDEDLYGFETAADLVAFVRTNTDNDLTDHPAWKGLTEANAHKLEPADDNKFDLIAVEEVISEKPTAESVTTLANTLAIVSSIGSVCELPAVMKFFNGNPTLGTLTGGIEHFAGKVGIRRWKAPSRTPPRPNWPNRSKSKSRRALTALTTKSPTRILRATPTPRASPLRAARSGALPATRWCWAATRTSG